MADLNTTYNGYVEKLNTVWQIEVCHGVNTPFGCIGGTEQVDVSDDPIHADSKAYAVAVNQNSVITVEAVKVPYQSGQDRLSWLKDRLDAINKRVSFIQDRCQPLQATLVQGGKPDQSESLGLAIASVNSITLPGIGTVLNKILTAQIASDNQTELNNAVDIINRYKQDLSDLGIIKKQITEEIISATSNLQTATNTAATNNAPTVSNNTWYYLLGLIVLLILIVSMRRKTGKRK